ncbi:MAG: MotA/TolQ/ExbB proton channel family protein [Lentisphaeraceae bacterium]|nr:MotA/TolQ/ExbB proton channel family protein [Lentisphaeraceae bacterium]
MKKVFLGIFVLFAVLPVLAAPEKASEAAGGMTTLFQQGGNTLLVLMVLSIFFVTLSIFMLMTLRKEVMAPKGFLQDAEAAARDEDLEALKVICGNSNSPAAKIIGAAAEEIVINPNVSYNAIRDSVEDEGNRQAGNIYQKVQYIMDIAVAAPMIGLLGTVLGMREAFSGLRVDIGSSNPVNLADGVSKALITTAAGLILGITAMVIHSYFRGRVHDLLSGLENSCAKILRVFANKSQGSE